MREPGRGPPLQRNQEAVDDHPVFRAEAWPRARPDRACCAGLFGVKQRIRAWLREFDDEQLASFGLTPEDILVRATELPALLRKPAPGGATMFERDNSLPPSLFLQAERQARLDSLVIKACMRGTMSRLAEWLSALGTWGTRLARNLADGWLLRCAIRELHPLDDRTLADIGITRGEIESALRNGLPTRVTHNLRQHTASSSAR